MQGWDEKSRGGLGAEDNLGRREPVVAKVKSDTLGVGGKKVRADKTGGGTEAGEKGNRVKGAREVRREYIREREVRKELMAYMNG
jgi:hypothetical protein